MTDDRIAAQSSAATIYDLGYRHYEGVRRGRLYAFWSLYVDTMRAIFGFGRSFRSKAVPFGLLALYGLGAVWQVAVLAFAQSFNQQDISQIVNIFTYDNYFRRLSFFVILFCVAQAPDLLDKDQRYHTLPLYFTRALTRLDYAVARLAGLTTGILIVLLVPMAGLFGGRAFLAPDVIQGFRDQMPSVLPGLAACLLTAFTLAALSLAISAFSPRRAYSAISMIAYFLLAANVPVIIFEIGQNQSWDWANALLLARPTDALIQATNYFFGVPIDISRFDYVQGMGDDLYAIAAVIMAAVATVVLLLRYRRMPA